MKHRQLELSFESNRLHRIGAGVGLAIVPLLTVDTTDPTISVRATVPELEPRSISIVWSRERTLSPIGERFVDIAADVCADLLKTPVA